jgi:hypothetical protein
MNLPVVEIGVEIIDLGPRIYWHRQIDIGRAVPNGKNLSMGFCL